MNYIEEHGKKVAAVLCVASCFPVVAAVYAMETEPGWHGDRYINTDTTVAKGWQEIEGKSYYFDENGEVDKNTTQKATVATVSSNVTQDVQNAVSQTTKDAVQQEVQAVEEQKAQAQAEAAAQAEESAKIEEVSQVETLTADTTQPTESVQVVEDTTTTVSQPTYTEDTVVEAPTSEPAVEDPTVQVPVQDTTVTTPAEDTTVQTPAPQQPTVDTTVSQEPVVDNTVSQEPVVDDTASQAPTVDTTVTAPSADPYADLNSRIAAEAQKLVGVTDGMWCTQVVQLALANAGVSDAYQLWPDQYVSYGYYTSTPTAGNLVYYNNGGRGVDHIAIYIGNGMCVHGNYNGKTVIASVYDGGVGAPQYIQVQR